MLERGEKELELKKKERKNKSCHFAGAIHGRYTNSMSAGRQENGKVSRLVRAKESLLVYMHACLKMTFDSLTLKKPNIK